MIYLLFGRIKDCMDFVYRQKESISYIHVSKPASFRGLQDVRLVWCGPFDQFYHNLYEEAKRYFELRNIKHE